MAEANAVVVAPAPRRWREKTTTFVNVVANSRATLEIPRYARTLERLVLKMGGTTMNRGLITAWRLKLGQGKTISEGTGNDQQKINKYNGLYDHLNYLTLDFTNPRDKTQPGELIGGIDMTAIPAGRVYLEVDIGAATAPTLDALFVWAPPQGNSIIKRQLKAGGAFSVTGRNNVPISVNGADIARMYMMYNGNDWCGAAATATAWTGNTGNGVPGAVTVSAGAQVGTHKFVCTQANANLGTFQHFLPDGSLNSLRLVVASAYSSAGLAWTLADGATDFIPGDGFDVIVGQTSDGNINRNEFKIDGTPIFDRTCNEARFEQREYGAVPQSQVFVTDFIVERNPEGFARTLNAKSVESNWYATATDTFTLYLEVLQDANTI